MANRFEPNDEYTCGIFIAKRNSKCFECKKMLLKGTWGAMWDGKPVHYACHKLAKNKFKLLKQQEHSSIIQTTFD